MIVKKNKLILRSQKTFFSVSKKKFFQTLVVFWRAEEFEDPQFAVIVPKKNFLLATKRNQIKRKAYGVIAKYLKTHSSLRNRQMVVVVKNHKRFDSLFTKDLEIALGSVILK